MNLDTLVTGAEAARYLKCARQRINWWAKAGHMTPAGRNRQGHPAYRLRDVLEAERITRHSPNSRRAA